MLYSSATIFAIMSTYLLIHGAWHGGWCWRKVVPLLEAKGHKVLAPDLPGHGDDRTATATVTLKSYADRICEIASAQTKPVILAGHSMGGVAITQAAENCPKKIGALVYVCAFLPRNGDSLMTWATQDQGSMVNPSTTDQHADGTIDFKPEHSREAFYGQLRSSCSGRCRRRRHAGRLSPSIQIIPHFSRRRRSLRISFRGLEAPEDRDYAHRS